MSALYIHIPFCKKRCNYCTFVSICNYSLSQQYIDAVIKELKLRRKQFENITTLDSVFIGGGTPSSLPVEQLELLLREITTLYNFSQNYEFSIECNPESVTEQLVELFCRYGVNRVSLGLQSSNDKTLQLIGRIHTAEQFKTATDTLKKYNINNFNADIIIGLPEKLKDTLNSVEFAIKCGAKHISTYALEVYPESKMAQDIAKGLYSITDDQDELSEMYDKVGELLSNNGFHRYEVSNYALSEQYRCRHNLTYWRAKNYLGVGCSAHWYMNNNRYGNTESVQKYIELMSRSEEVAQCYQTLSEKDVMDEVVMLGLRLSDGVNLLSFEQQFGKYLMQVYPSVQRYIDLGFLQVIDNNLIVKPDKIYVLNSILAELL